MKNNRRFVSCGLAVLTFTPVLLLLQGCGGTSDGNVSPSISPELEISSQNDSDNDGIRDVVEDSIAAVSQSFKQEVMLRNAASKQQEVIEASSRGDNIDEAVIEYKEAFYCLIIGNLDENGDPINNSIALLQLMTLTSTDSVDAFESLTSDFSSLDLNIQPEDCE